MRSFISLSAAVALAAYPAVPCGVRAQAPDEPSAKTVKIMCVGDSITDGYGVTGSYRKYLFHGLEEAGLDPVMLGSKDCGTLTFSDPATGENFSYQNDNVGYSGYAISKYPGRNGILQTLKSTGCLEKAPDVVILQIGTNDVIDAHDIASSGERLSELAEYILANVPEETALFVTTIPYMSPNLPGVYDWFSNYRHSPDWQTSYSDESVAEAVKASVDLYNSIVRETVGELRAKGENVFLGNVNSVISDPETMLADGVHPNEKGYRLIGEYWAETIESCLGAAPDIPEKSFRIADVVKLAGFILGDEGFGLSDSEALAYDLDADLRITSFDLALMRSAVIENGLLSRSILD